jgi:CrcB protein
MKEILIVGIGGFAGSVSRYLIQTTMVNRFITVFPLGTFTINIIGSLLIGVIFGLADRYQFMTQEWRLLLAIGFCGSFTTFSTFAFENLQMIKDGKLLKPVPGFPQLPLRPSINRVARSDRSPW